MVNIERIVVGYIRSGDMRCEAKLGSFMERKHGQIIPSGRSERQCSHRAHYIIEEQALCRNHTGDALINYHTIEPQVNVEEEFVEVTGKIGAITQKGVKLLLPNNTYDWFPISQILNAESINTHEGNTTLMIKKWLMDKRKEEGRELQQTSPPSN